jgi:hypothetical protein
VRKNKKRTLLRGVVHLFGTYGADLFGTYGADLFGTYGADLFGTYGADLFGTYGTDLFQLNIHCSTCSKLESFEDSYTNFTKKDNGRGFARYVSTQEPVMSVLLEST